MARSSRITIFKWGYEGWGNATKQLVRSVDAIERERGHEPPLFIDIRYSRSVRAKGFRDHAFEEQMGHARYRWMRSLGNKSIKTRRKKMQIQCPDAAQQLLDSAIDAAEQNRRVIFFCSCPSPHGAGYCHRTKVAKLVARAAKRRGVRIEIEEWPGSMPAKSPVASIRVGDAELRKVRNGAKSIGLTARQASMALEALPWGAMVELVSGRDRQLVSVGPAQYRARQWQLPIFLFPVGEDDAPRDLTPWVQRLRSGFKLQPLRS
jgi:hypothetical protein